MSAGRSVDEGAVDPMSPSASPGQLGGRSGGRRVNDRPIYIVVAVMGVFLLSMGVVAADRAAQQDSPDAAPKEKAGSSAMFASAITGDQKGGMVPAERAAPPAVPDMPPPGAVAIARPENPDAPPVPPALPAPSGGDLPTAEPPRNDEHDRIRMAKLQQLEEAIRARTGVPMVAPRSAGSPPGGGPNAGARDPRQDALARLAAVRQQIDAQTRDNPTAAYQARLQQLQAAGLGVPTTPPRLLPPAATVVGRNDVAQFDRASPEDRWKLDAQPEAPRSPYELRAGFVVPAMLISGINSDLPGQIVAQVSQDVFDTATGKWKLIPQGSRLVGRYASDVAYGQSRVLVAWQRIVFPDGKAMDTGSLPGADSAGQAGFNDQVNNHAVRLFTSAFLMSGVTAGITYSQRQSQGTSAYAAPTAQSALSEALGQQLGQVTAQLIARNMGIAPTLQIRPGYRFNVVVTRDMTFSKPYRAFDY